MPTYPQKIWRQREVEPSKRVDLTTVGRQLEGLWPILESLDGPGFLTADHVGILTFGHQKKATKTANDRLRRLYSFGLLNAFRAGRENQPTRGGSSPLIYCLTREGAQLLAAYGQVSVSELQWRERQELLSMATIAHRLDLADIHVALAVHCRAQGAQLLRFVYEPRYPLPKAPDVDHKELWPDALAEIEAGGRRWSLLIEVDRNTERPKRFAERVARYEAFYKHSEWERWLVEAPTVLVVATEGGRPRVHALREATVAAMNVLDVRFRRYRFAALSELYRVERSSMGYTAPVYTFFDRPVCSKPLGDELVAVLAAGGAE